MWCDESKSECRAGRLNAREGRLKFLLIHRTKRNDECGMVNAEVKTKAFLFIIHHSAFIASSKSFALTLFSWCNPVTEKKRMAHV